MRCHERRGQPRAPLATGLESAPAAVAGGRGTNDERRIEDGPSGRKRGRERNARQPDGDAHGLGHHLGRGHPRVVRAGMVYAASIRSS